MRAWVKLWTEILHDRKMWALTDRQFRVCTNLIAMAGIVDDDGELMPFDDMVFQLRLSPDDLTADLQALRKLNIVDTDGADWWLVHFEARQPKPPSAEAPRILERVHKHRAKVKAEREASVTTRNDVTAKCNDPVTSVTTDVTSVTSVTSLEENRREEKRGDERRAVPCTAPVWKAFEQARGGAVNSLDGEQLGDLEGLYGAENMVRAIQWCNSHKDRPFLGIGYIAATLAGWQKDGMNKRGNGTEPEVYIGPALPNPGPEFFEAKPRKQPHA